MSLMRSRYKSCRTSVEGFSLVREAENITWTSFFEALKPYPFSLMIGN